MPALSLKNRHYKTEPPIHNQAIELISCFSLTNRHKRCCQIGQTMRQPTTAPWRTSLPYKPNLIPWHPQHPNT